MPRGSIHHTYDVVRSTQGVREACASADTQVAIFCSLALKMPWPHWVLREGTSPQGLRRGKRHDDHTALVTESGWAAHRIGAPEQQLRLNHGGAVDLQAARCRSGIDCLKSGDRPSAGSTARG